MFFGRKISLTSRLAPALLGTALLSLAPAAADATAYYSFAFTQTQGTAAANPGDITGVLEVNDAGTTITGLSGTTGNLGGIAALLPPGSFSGNLNPSDNGFSSAFPFLTSPGVSFTTTTGDGVNLARLNNGYRAISLSGGQSVGTFSVTRAEEPPVSVPEPASLMLLGFGLAGLAMTRRRYRNA